MRFIFVILYIGKRIQKLIRYQRVRNTGKVTYTQYAQIQSPCLNDNIPSSLHRRTFKSHIFFIDTLPGSNILNCVYYRFTSVLYTEVLCFFIIKRVCLCVCVRARVCVCGPFILFCLNTLWLTSVKFVSRQNKPAIRQMVFQYHQSFFSF